MFLVDNGMPTDVRDLTREPVETYISVQVERYRPKTASTRFGDLQQFLKWAVEEREMDSSPMVNMKILTVSGVAQMIHTMSRTCP